MYYYIINLAMLPFAKSAGVVGSMAIKAGLGGCTHVCE